MIQFNLLPNVKVEYLKIKRQKRIISLVAAGVILACSVVLIGLFSIVLGVQPNRLSGLDKSIKSISNDIKSKKDINKILTIQNQLTAIDGLHEDKPVTTRLSNLLVKITPKDVSIQNFTVDFKTLKIDVTGQAKSFEEMNKFIDTLKFTTLKKGDSSNGESTKAFSQVVLNSYSLSDKGAGFVVSFIYDNEIFKSSSENLTLEVPSITSTRSETERPTDLFKINQTPTGEGDDE